LEGYVLDAQRGSGAHPTVAEPAPMSVRGVTTARVPDLARIARETGLADPPDGEHGVADATCWLHKRGRAARQLTFATLIEAIVTGRVTADDEVDLGQGRLPLASIPAFARYLPNATGTTTRLAGPGVPDFQGPLAEGGLAE